MSDRDQPQNWEGFFAEEYGRLGPETRTRLYDLLPEGWTFEGKRVLDFGCGPGRTLRHFTEEASKGEFWGVDIDPSSIESFEDCDLPLHTRVCDLNPPLEFEDESFDFIWAISVFTHLTDNSADWLIELHRILKPGGRLMATFMGPAQSEIVAFEPWDENRVGMNVLYKDRTREEGTPMVFMSDWWVREHWGRLFEVETIEDIHSQRWPMLVKKAVNLTAAEVMALSDDPRELDALRHNLVQVQEEASRLHQTMKDDRARQQEALDAQRADFESSASWRATKPLRRIMSRTRRS